jgi:Fe-S-cluster containining protein
MIPPARDAPVPECLSCGACCFGLIVRVDPDDEERLTLEERRELTQPDQSGVLALRAAPDGRCLALEVTEGRFFCRIYDRRPGVCVAFERGSRPCADARRDREKATAAPLL